MNEILLANHPSKLVRQELDEFCSRFRHLLEGPMRQQRLAIKSANDYFTSIPEADRTAELSALQELFSVVWDDTDCGWLLDDLKLMESGLISAEVQDEFWFNFQHIFYIRACRLELYYPVAQQAAEKFGFVLLA